MKTGPTVRLRAARRADERGSSSVEALLLLPAMMLLAVFVLWAGRAGQAALATDLAAEEAATVAALHCEQGKAEECGALVSDVLSTNSQLGFLCVGGPRAVGDDPLVQQAWLRGGLGGGPLTDEDVGVLGVRFGCETDGAVAPLRGLLPNVTFYGQSTEVAVRPSLPTLRIWDAAGVEEGSTLEFVIELTESVGQAVTLDYTISAETPYTSASSDYADGALTVTIPAGSLEARITVVTHPYPLHEDDEQIMVRLGAVPVDAVSGNPLLSYSDAQGLGTIVDNDDLVVVVADSEPAQEEVDEFVVFAVEVLNAGRDGVVSFDTEDMTDPIVAPGDPGARAATGSAATGHTACVDPPTPDEDTTPDYQTTETDWLFTPHVVSGKVEIPLCPDVHAERKEQFNLNWRYWAPRTVSAGVAVGTIEADLMRLFVSDNCDEGPLQVTVAGADACDAESDLKVEFKVSLAPVYGGFPPDFQPVTVQYVARPVDPLTTVEHPATGWGTDTANPCDVAPGAEPLPLEAHEAEGDFESVRNTLIFAAGGDPTEDKTLPVEVPVYDDALDEHDEVLWLTLCNIPSTVRTSSDQGLGVIADDDLEPHLAVFDAEEHEGDELVEGDVWLEFDVELDAVSAKDVTVEYHTADFVDPDYLERLIITDRVPASKNLDYVQILERTGLTIPAGERSATIRVDIVEDRRVEGADEVFAVRLRVFNASLASSETDTAIFCDDNFVGDDCAIGTIIEDDFIDIDEDGIEDRPLHLSINDAMAYEGQDLKFLIKLMDDRGELAPIVQDLDLYVETQGLPIGYDYRYGSRRGSPENLYYMGAVDGTEHSLLSTAVDIDYEASYPAQSAPANPDLDYEPAVRVITIPAGESQVEVTVRTLSDTIDEHYERFALRVRSEEVFLPLEASTNCVGPDVVGAFTGVISSGVDGGDRDDCAVGTIADLNLIPRVAIDRRSAVEGRDAQFTVRLVDQYSGVNLTSAKDIIRVVASTGTVDLAHAATTGDTCGVATFGGGLPDFETLTGEVLLFEPGQSIGTFNVTICEDGITENSYEEFRVVVGAGDKEYLAKTFSDTEYETDLASRRRIRLYDVDGFRVSVTHIGSETGSTVREGQKALFEVQVLPRAEPGETELDGYPEVHVYWRTSPKSYDADDSRGSADAGDDYVDDSGKLTFDPFESVKLIEVETVDDEISEGLEGFEVVLSNPSGDLVLADYRADALIVDNDCLDMEERDAVPAGVHLVPSDGPEAGSHMFTVELDQRICGSIEYRVRANPISASSDDLDSDWIEFDTPFYRAGYHELEDQALLEFLEGLVLKRFHVPITEDEIDEEHETYQIEFEWNSGQHAGTKSAPSSLATIYDDDTSLVTVDDASEIEGKTLTFFVRLSVPNSRTVTIDYETREAYSSQNRAKGAATVCAPGDDFIHKAGSVTILPGQTAAPIAVQLCGDTLPDGGEQFLLSIEWPQASPKPAEIADNWGEGTILDLFCVAPRNAHDPVPVISATDASVRFREDDRSASISVKVDPPFCDEQTHALKFDFTAGTADAADLPTGDAPLYSGVASRTAVTAVPLVHTTGDTIEEPETYTWTVNWDPELRARYPKYDSTPDIEIEVTLIDGDDGSLPVVTLGQDASVSRAAEGGDVPFEVQLDRAATQPVTVHYETADHSGAPAPATLDDYSPTSAGELTLDPGETGGRILVTTQPDNTDEQDETFLLRLTGADNAVLNATSPNSAVGTILDPCVDPRDPDAPAVTITPVLDPSSAPLVGRWTEGHTTVQVDFELSRRLCSPTTVRYVVGVIGSSGGTATPGVDFVRRSGLVWVSRLQWRFPLDITLLDDDLLEQEETLVASVEWGSGTPPSWRNIAAVHATGAIDDDDVTEFTPSLSVNSPEAVEGSDLVFEVELSTGIDTPVFVDVTTRRLHSDDAAWPGRDYFDWSGTLEFRPNETLKLVRVRTVPDDDVEQHERMQLRLSLSAPSEDVVLATEIGTGTILDDDCFSLDSFGPADSPPPLVFHERGSSGELLGSGHEGNQIRFEVAPAQRFCETVYLQAEALPGSAGASDFSADPAALGRVEVPYDGVGAFVVEAQTDDLNEVDETFEVTAHWHPDDNYPLQFYDPAAAGPVYSTIATILDGTSQPTVTANSPQVVEGETAEFEITLSALGDRTVRMQYHTRDGTATDAFDYERARGTLVFRPGDPLMKRIEVATRIDSYGGQEANETFELVLRNPQNAVFSEPGDMVVEAMIEDFESKRVAERLPTNVTVTPVERALVVRWNAPTYDDPTVPLVQFVIKVVPVSGQLYEPPIPDRVSVSADVAEVQVGGLVAGVTYRVMVRAEYSDGIDVSAEPVLGTPLALGTPLDPPNNVSLAPVAYYRRFIAAEPALPVLMRVSWSRPAPADGVLATELRWAPAGTPPADAAWREALVGPSQRTYETSGNFLFGQTYQMWVRHWNLDGPGGWAESTGHVVFEPGRVRVSSVVGDGSGALGVRLVDPQWDGGTPITGYDVEYRKRNSSAAWSGANVSVDVAQRTAAVTGLLNGTWYEVRARAFNASLSNAGAGPGKGEWSLLEWGRASTVPDAPVIYRLRPDDRSLEVYWRAPAADGGDHIRGYEVQYREASSIQWSQANVDMDIYDGVVNTRTAKITRLTNLVEYEVQVRAFSSSGADIGYGRGVGPWSSTVTAVVKPPDPPSAPLDVSVEPGPSRGISVRWDAPEDNGGAPIEEYQVAWKSTVEGYDDYFDDWQRSMFISKSNYLDNVRNDEGMDINNVVDYLHMRSGGDPIDPALVQFDVRVRAYHEGGFGSWSAIATGGVADLPGSPQDLSAAIEGVDGIRLNWRPPTDDGGAAVEGYLIFWRERGSECEDCWGQISDADISRQQVGLLDTYLIENLDPTKRYTIAIKALNSASVVWATTYGELAVTTVDMPGVLQPHAPAAPSIVRIVPDDGRVVVEWDETSTDLAPISEIRLRWRPQGGTWVDATFGKEFKYNSYWELKTAHTIDGLTNGTTYEVEVSAANDHGSSSATATATPGLIAGAPQNLEAEGWVEQFDVSWGWVDSPTYPIDGFQIRWRPSYESTFDPAGGSHAINGQVLVDAGKREHRINMRANMAGPARGDTFIIEVTALNGSTSLGTTTISEALYPVAKFVHEDFIPTYKSEFPWLEDVVSLGFPFQSQWVLRGLPVGLTHFWVAHLRPDNPNETQYIPQDSRTSFIEFQLSAAWDRLRDDPSDVDALGLLTHEMAHALTQDQRLLTPALTALWLYHYKWIEGIEGNEACDVSEVIADTIEMYVFPDAHSSYYDECFGDGAVPADKMLEALKATEDALNGVIPESFDGQSLADGFIVANAAATPLPWGLGLDWDKPFSSSSVNTYVVQWKRGNQSYDGSRTRVIRGLHNTSTTITNLVCSGEYTVRLAVVSANSPGIMWDYFGNQRFVELPKAQTMAC